MMGHVRCPAALEAWAAAAGGEKSRFGSVFPAGSYAQSSKSGSDRALFPPVWPSFVLPPTLPASTLVESNASDKGGFRLPVHLFFSEPGESA